MLAHTPRTLLLKAGNQGEADDFEKGPGTMVLPWKASSEDLKDY